MPEPNTSRPDQTRGGPAADTEIAELITMLVRFRTQAVASVTATLASSIETTIESLVSQILAEYLERSPEADAG